MLPASSSQVEGVPARDGKMDPALGSLSPKLEICVESGADGLERLREAWMELVDDSVTATLFQTYEWQSAWWRSYRRGKRPYLVQAFEGGRLVGLMPLTLTVGLWRALKPMGKGPSCFLHPLARTGYESSVADALMAHLSVPGQYDYIDLSMIRSTEPLAARFPEDETYTLYPSHAICLPGQWDEVAAGLPRKFRQKLRHFDKRDWRYEGCAIRELAAEAIPDGLERLFAWSNQRWQGRAADVAFESRRLRQLYRDWCANAAVRGWIRLIELDLKGEPAGVLLACKVGSAVTFQMQGFPEAHRRLSPGMVLAADTVRWAISQGASTFEFLMGDESYKHDWSPNLTHQLIGWRHIAPGFRGGLARCWYRAGVWGLNRLAALRGRLRAKGASLKARAVDEEAG